MKADQECNDAVCSLDESSMTQPTYKPLELFYFIDISNPSGFEIMSLVKKLEIEYDHLVRFRMISTVPRCIGECEETVRLLKLIKSLELQGKRHAMRFLRHLHAGRANWTETVRESRLWEIIESFQKFGLDTDELNEDLCSHRILNQVTVDHEVLRDWEIESLPAMTIISNEEALKIEGVYPYKVYVSVLKDLLGYEPPKQQGWDVETVLKRYDASTISELSFLLDTDPQTIERELKKLSLQQKCTQVPGCKGQAWTVAVR